jgi:diacylglycerol kinase family enzyme
LAGTPVALAILPFGTANALAHDLKIPLRPH